MEITIYEAEKQKIISERAHSLLKILRGNDQSQVQEIANKADGIVSVYNNQNHTVINPTQMELGKWNTFIKSCIKYGFKDQLLDELKQKYYGAHESYYEEDLCKHNIDWTEFHCEICDKERKDIRDNSPTDLAEKEIKDACNNLIVDKEIKEKYILLLRKSSSYNRSPLEMAVQDSLKVIIQQEFFNQYNQLITKYTNYEASK